jgi:hypothetical protein
LECVGAMAPVIFPAAVNPAADPLMQAGTPAAGEYQPARPGQLNCGPAAASPAGGEIAAPVRGQHGLWITAACG